jgi:hypothetical protein
MATNPKVFVGAHALEIAPSASGGSDLKAHAASVESIGGAAAGTACNFTLKINPHHPNVHLKTKAHWILGWVPPPEKKGHKRTFFVGRQWQNNGFWRYWGFVTFGGRKHYGWVDHVHFEKRRGKSTKKPGSYDAFRGSVHNLMKRAWRYRGEFHKVPVLAEFPTAGAEVNLYNNRDAGEAPAVVVKRPKDHPFRFAVRWAGKGWILVAHGGGHGWYFIQASYKTIKLNPTKKLHKRDKQTQTMTPNMIPPSWA